MLASRGKLRAVASLRCGASPQPPYGGRPVATSPDARKPWRPQVFVRVPQTLFSLEERRERKLHDVCAIVQVLDATAAPEGDRAARLRCTPLRAGSLRYVLIRTHTHTILVCILHVHQT